VERLQKDQLFLTDMTKNALNPWHRRQRSKTYLLLVPLLALFYMVPSAQMVYAEFQRSKESGRKIYLNFFGSSQIFLLLKHVGLLPYYFRKVHM
jgi:hypothetical protein